MTDGMRARASGALVRRSPPAARGRWRWRVFSSLTWRILAINLLALGIVVAGMLYVDAYRRGLIEARAESLRTQAALMAGALGEVMVAEGEVDRFAIDARAARRMLRRLVLPVKIRARLFDSQGALLADSNRLPGIGPVVEAEALPPPEGPIAAAAAAVYDWIVAHLPARERLEPYRENEIQRARDYRETAGALAGVPGWALRDGGSEGAIISVAVPVQRFKHVQGALMLSTTTADVEEAVRAVRYAILELSAVALAVTIALSLFLAATIVRPLRRLADAAYAVRRVQGRTVAIPDYSARRDEIGELSRALLDMTDALADRIDAIERFAADVAHEIKNPLSSLRSAVETIARVDEPDQQRRLLAIVEEDVQRLNRLIGDIADASRLDAELARAPSEPVDLGRLLAAVVEVHRARRGEDGPEIHCELPAGERLVAPGIESRLVQVIENLIANARSFSPPGGAIRLAARRDDGWIEVTVEDQGPGIPPGKLDAVFDRFYSDRPAGEKFGTHSGLGLSICRQIVEAHGGTIRAENIGDDEHPEGARFILRLPA